MDVYFKYNDDLLIEDGTISAMNEEGQVMAIAHLDVNGKKVKLADIEVYSDTALWFGWLPWPKRKICYRNKGVGTKLLQKIISLCKASSVSQLYGDVVGDSDRLKPWYEKHGFNVTKEEVRIYFRESV